MCHLQVHLDNVLQSLIDSQADTPAQQLCVEAATILLDLVKAIITQVRMEKPCTFLIFVTANWSRIIHCSFMFQQPVPPAKYMSGTDASWAFEFPASVMQFLCLLHNLRPRDPLWASPEFLHALAGVVYPLDCSEVWVFLWICETNSFLSLVLLNGLFTSFSVWLSLAWRVKVRTHWLFNQTGSRFAISSVFC